MAVKQKRTPNQIEFDKQIARLNRIVKQIERETGRTIDGFDIPRPKRITKQKIEELKAIKPKFLREQLTGTAQRLAHGEIKPPKIRKPTPDIPSGRQRNASLDAMLRSARRKKKPKQEKQKTVKQEKRTRTKKATPHGAPTTKTTQPKLNIIESHPDYDKTSPHLGGKKETPLLLGGEKYPLLEGEIEPPLSVSEAELILYEIRGLIEDWEFLIEGAHEGYEEVKEADRNLVSMLLESAVSELGEIEVALNIKNNSDYVYDLVSRIIYGSDETTVQFDLAELARIFRNRSLTIAESVYLSELFESRTLVDYDTAEFTTKNPYFASLSGYDED